MSAPTFDAFAEIRQRVRRGEPLTNGAASVLVDAVEALQKTPAVPVGPLEVVSSFRKSRRFVLNRENDPTGISGTGIVAWGVEWPDGTVSLRWNTRYRSSVTYEQGMAAVDAIHGHEGLTKVVWLDHDESS